MADQQLLDYISLERSNGKPDAVIKAALRENNWSEDDITEGFSQLKKNLPVHKTALWSNSTKLVVIPLCFVLLLGLLSGYILRQGFVLSGLKTLQKLDQVPSPTIITVQTKTIVPTPTAVLEAISPDGTKKLSIHTEKTVTRSFNTVTLIENATGKQTIVFSQDIGSSLEMHISQKAWSPDTKYFFVNIAAAGGDNAYIFQGDGTSFADGSNYLDLAALFNQQTDRYVWGNIIWSGPSLLQFRSQKTPMTMGPSYTFTLPTQTFQQL